MYCWLLPYSLPDSDVVEYYIEEKKIPSYTCEDCYENSIDDFFLLSFYSIEGTDALTAEVPDKSDSETEESECTEVPLIFSVKGICK